jgi:glycosyltransferase involved in cell wall biosynthesis
VRWHRYVTDEELAGLYRRAWVFCVPSSYEGFGLPYVEAMSHGTPVVSTPNFGALSVLGGAGRIVDRHRIGSALVELLQRPDQRRRLAELGRARAREFAWSRVVDEHERAYRLATERWAERRRPAAAPIASS